MPAIPEVTYGHATSQDGPLDTRVGLAERGVGGEPGTPGSMTRYDAPAWAIRNGLMAALRGDERWCTWLALTTYLPQVCVNRRSVARLAGLDLRTVKRAIAELEGLGLLTRSESLSDDGRFVYSVINLADVRDVAVVERAIQRLRDRTGSWRLYQEA